METTIIVVLVLAGIAGMLAWRRRERRWQERLAAERAKAEKVVETQRQLSAQAQAQQSALFERMIEGVLLLDSRGRILMINQSLKDLLRPAADVRGKTILEAFRIPPLVEMAGQLPRKQVLRHSELELPGLNPHLVEVNATAIMDANGNYDGAIFVFHDLTRIKQLENTRREFVANVSHELRTPLSLIKGFVETLLDGGTQDPDQTKRFLQTIEKHTDRLTFLIEDLLTISRLESGAVTMNRETVLIRDLTERVFDDLTGKAAERHVTLENNVPADLAAHADADRLQQVIFNLVENSIKYGREGGRVVVHGETNSENVVTCSVRDDGPGIPLESQARIFERFYRVDRARSRESGGTGLGLSIVKHIVLAHGGSVWVESEPEKGATFFLTVAPGF